MNFTQFKKYFVGGVNSPVRSFKDVGGKPFVVKKAKWAFLYDTQSNKYIDFVLSWGPMILGHADIDVIRKVKNVLERGFSYGAPHILELELAKVLKKAIPELEFMRFVNSGTEAVMSAIRLARGYTGYDYIIKFEGCYHGHSDFLLAKAGSGLLTFNVAYRGVPQDAVKKTIILPYNDSNALIKAFKGKKIAAILLEPICGNMGVVLPNAVFIDTINKISEKYGAVVIADEVITGFRFRFGAVSSILGLKPKIICLGKIVGGGAPFAVYGGLAEIMRCLAPMGEIYQAGTLSGNPIACATGLYTLQKLKKLNPYKKLDEATVEIVDTIRFGFSKKGIPVTINRFGSMFTVFFTGHSVYDLNSAMKSDRKMYSKFFHALLNNGIYFPPSQFEACFISIKHIEIIGEIKKRLLKAISSIN